MPPLADAGFQCRLRRRLNVAVCSLNRAGKVASLVVRLHIMSAPHIDRTTAAFHSLDTRNPPRVVYLLAAALEKSQAVHAHLHFAASGEDRALEHGYRQAAICQPCLSAKQGKPVARQRHCVPGC